MAINIVLIAPEIPQNTGGIGRLCVCLDARLHLIKPLGFSLDDSYVRRAGMDYWQYVQLNVHETWGDFLAAEEPEKLCFSSTKTTRCYLDYAFPESPYIVFGSESSGLPPDFYERYADDLYTIPMPGQHMRSLNLSNAVAVMAYEAYRQLMK
jgi:tRNA (cytidine/uridine-2'-O-)-methyltransferase